MDKMTEFIGAIDFLLSKKKLTKYELSSCCMRFIGVYVFKAFVAQKNAHVLDLISFFYLKNYVRQNPYSFLHLK
jgi:hypothetical protein